MIRNPPAHAVSDFQYILLILICTEDLRNKAEESNRISGSSETRERRPVEKTPDALP
jgi:hypothetical protein